MMTVNYVFQRRKLLFEHHLQELSKIMKAYQNSLSEGIDLDPGPLKYEAGVPTPFLQYSAKNTQISARKDSRKNRELCFLVGVFP
jgi:hypothetical protein